MPYADPVVKRVKGREYTRQWRERQVLDSERFWQQVEKTATCWLWLGSKPGRGYGRLWVQGKSVAAHRIAYELLVGQIPDGLELDHLCRVHACVRPSHLEAVPHRTNILRGEGLAAQQAQRTACPYGHLYDYQRPDGKRACRECVRQAGRKYRAKQRSA